MLLITCPYCGPRAEIEFSYAGEAIARPTDSEQLSDEAWGDYVFMRQNIKGTQTEQWRHISGCGRWFNARRNTATHRFEASWKVGQTPPPIATPPNRGTAPSGGGA